MTEPTDAELDKLIRDANPTQGLRHDSRDLPVLSLRKLMRDAIAKWGQPAHSGGPVHTNTEKTIERYLTIFKDHTTGQYYAAPFLHEELIKSSKYARDMSEYQINKTCVAQLKLAFVEGHFEDI